MLWECRKILSVRLAALALLLSAAIPVIWYGADLFSASVGDAVTPSAYRALVSDVQAGDLQEERDALDAEYESILYDGTVPEKMYSDTLGGELSLYNRVTKEISQVLDYPNYLESVRTQSEWQGSSSLHRQSASSQRNLRKTAADYAAMEGTDVRFVGTYGVSRFMETGVCDIVAVLVMVFAVAFLILPEMSSGRVGLMSTTAHGRVRAAYCKYGAGIIILIVFMAILYGGRLALTACAYGLGDVSAPFQSVYGAQGCTLHLTVGGAVTVFLLIKIFAVLSLYSLTFLLACLLRSGILFYCVFMLVLGAEAAAYYWIGVNSYLSMLKWINLTALIHTDAILTTYKNLMIFGYPVAYFEVICIFCAIIIALALALLGIFFVRLRFAAKSVMPEEGYARTESALTAVLGGRRLGAYEFRKWIFYQRGIFIIVGACVVAALLYKPADLRLYTSQEIGYRNYVREVEGEFSQDKMDYLYGEKERLDEIAEKASSGEEIGLATSSYYQAELSKMDGLIKTIDYGEYLGSKNGLAFVYEKGYGQLLWGGDYGWRLFAYELFSIALEILLAVLIWGMERQSGMDVMIAISKVGTRRINRKKTLQIFLTGIVTFVIVYVPWIYSVLSVYGAPCINYPARSMMRFAALPGWIRIWTLLAIFYGLHLVALWIVGWVINFAFARKKP